jgi:hypothetical protein
MRRHITREQVVKITPLGTKLVAWDKETGTKYPGSFIVHDIYPDGRVILVHNVQDEVEHPDGQLIMDPPRKRALKRHRS